MAKYQVIRPWFGVKMGQIVDLEKVHPALAANVRPVAADAPDNAGEAADIVAKARIEADNLRQETEAELNVKIHAAIDEARVERDKIIAEAHKQADAIIAEARAAAEALEKVEQKGDLTPATPDATADKAKVTKPK